MICIRKIAGNRFPKKRCLGPQNGSGSLGPEKLLKIVNCAIIKETENAERNDGGGLGGLGRWPPISTWITYASISLLPFLLSTILTTSVLSCLISVCQSPEEETISL